MNTHSGTTLIVLAMIILMSTRSAYAYIDPGAGSMILQLVIGGLLAGLFGIKMFWRKIKSKITGKNDAPVDLAGKQAASKAEEDSENAGTK
ncbi:MAG: hypothetical protein HQ559_17550 [Lentisphaerae bacterium]|nr:hypothetical protein [Lentisphaerota bacterium]